jgi:hypothetical protein
MFRVKFFLFLIGFAANGILAVGQPSNDICSSATDIQGLIEQNQDVAGPFNNIGATGNDLDIAGITGCWLDDLTGNADGSSPQIDATVWFRFDGFDGVLSLFVQPCDSNLNFLSQDTQMVIYKGECDTLELVSCNEDLNPSSNYYWSGITSEIQSGSTYYLAVDGFNYSGFGSPELPLTTGEFCLSMQEPQVSVNENQLDLGLAYPNPSTGPIVLQANAPIQEVLICDVSGTVRSVFVNSGSGSAITMEMPEESGFYIVCVKTNRGTYTERIVRN